MASRAHRHLFRPSTNCYKLSVPGLYRCVSPCMNRERLAWPCIRGMRFHVGAQNGIDPRLITALLPEPGQQVRVQPYGDDLFTVRQDDLSSFPEVVIRGMGVGISLNARVNLGIAHPAQL